MNKNSELRVFVPLRNLIFLQRIPVGAKRPFMVGGVDLLNATNSRLRTFTPADWIDWTTPTLAGNLPWDPFA